MNSARRSNQDKLFRHPSSPATHPNRWSSQTRKALSFKSPFHYNLRSQPRKITRAQSSYSLPKLQHKKSEHGLLKKNKPEKIIVKQKKIEKDQGTSQNSIFSHRQQSTPPKKSEGYSKKQSSSHKRHKMTVFEVEQALQDEILHKYGLGAPRRSLTRSSMTMTSRRSSLRRIGEEIISVQKLFTDKSVNTTPRASSHKKLSKKEYDSGNISRETGKSSARKSSISQPKKSQSSLGSTSLKKRKASSSHKEKSTSKNHSSMLIVHSSGKKKDVRHHPVSPKSPGRKAGGSNEKGLRKIPTPKSPSRNQGIFSKDKMSFGKSSAGKSPMRISIGTPSSKSTVDIEMTPRGKASIGKMSAGKSPGKMLEESHRRTAKNTPITKSGQRSPGTPSKGKESARGKGSVGKLSAYKSPGKMVEESHRRNSKNTPNSKSAQREIGTPSKGKASKRKAERIIYDLDDSDLEALGGVIIKNSAKRVKRNEEETIEKGEKVEIKIVEIAKSKPTSSSNKRKSSGKKLSGTNLEQQSDSEEDHSDYEGSNKKKVNKTSKRISLQDDKKTPQAVTTAKVLGVRVVIKGNNFCIWRKLYLMDGLPFSKVARILVAAMGWMGYWNWIFKIDGMEIICPPDDPSDRPQKLENKKFGDEISLDFFGLSEGAKFQFIYNPKNPWIHEVVVEDIEIVELDVSGNAVHTHKSKLIQHAVLANGNLAVPPDYLSQEEFEEAFEDIDKGDKDFSRWKKKLGDGFDVMKLDKQKINEALKAYSYDESKMDPKFKEDTFFKW